MTRNAWLIGLGAIALAAILNARFWNVRRPPTPSAARLPLSAGALLPASRKDSFDLTVEPHGERDYRVGMQEGATLVYAWSTGNSAETLASEGPRQNASRGADAHGAFEAQSSGWYRWHWKNDSAKAITIHMKLSGYYEVASMPYDR